jgi:hypothetical protein
MEVAARCECAEAGVGLGHRFLNKVLSVSVIAGHPHGVVMERLKQRDHVGLKPRAQFAIRRVTYLCVELYSAASRFGDRAGRGLSGHRDTIVYPAKPNATGTIASIPSAAFNIVRSFPFAHPSGVWPSLGRHSGENVIGCRLLRSSPGQRKTIARGLMFRAG